jgi:hypothetical protein
MNRRLVVIVAISLFFCLAAVCLFAASQGTATEGQRKSSPKSKQATTSSEGEKRFRTNCGRCHHPPEDLSPREARAVVRQMRVRAMLSAEDARLILEYLAP